MILNDFIWRSADVATSAIISLRMKLYSYPTGQASLAVRS
jgi:hypothetical protein